MADVTAILSYLLIGVFVPLFPLSMVFNALFGRFGNTWWRGFLIVIWPLIGITLVGQFNAEIPDWVIVLALCTSLLYAFRALALRDVGMWASIIATSFWSLLWLVLGSGAEPVEVYAHALGVNLPLLVLIVLAHGLARRYGAAYTGLYGGLALTLPRFAGALVVAVLAIVATPMFPAFFTMLNLVVATSSIVPFVAGLILLIWLLWSWAGARLLQGLVVGPARTSRAINDRGDLSLLIAWMYALAFIGLIVLGVWLIGVTA